MRLTRATIALPALAAVVLAGCTAHHATPQAGGATRSRAASAPSGSLSIACRQAYAALSVEGWGLVSQERRAFGCRWAISETDGTAARGLVPPGLAVVPALAAKRGLSCEVAKALLAVFGVFPAGRALHR